MNNENHKLSPEAIQNIGRHYHDALKYNKGSLRENVNRIGVEAFNASPTDADFLEIFRVAIRDVLHSFRIVHVAGLDAWTLECRACDNGAKFWILVDHETHFADHPVRCDGRKVAWDRPEAVPPTIQSWVEAEIHRFEEKEAAMKDCEDCPGWDVFELHSGTPDQFLEIQRCDSCAKLPHDFEAYRMALELVLKKVQDQGWVPELGTVSKALAAAVRAVEARETTYG